MGSGSASQDSARRRISSSFRRVSGESRSEIRERRLPSGVRVTAGSSSIKSANSWGVARTEPLASVERCRAKSAV